MSRLGRLPRQTTRASSSLLAFVVMAACARPPQPATQIGDAVPTYAQDVAPILYKNCAACHHAGGMAPFSVASYDEVEPRADKIRERVADGVMPPWHSSDPRGTFTNDRRLSDAEKAIILKWVDDGAKAGDLSKQPAAPTFASGWAIGTPDAVFEIPKGFTVPASGTVDYQYFQVATNLPEDKWVQAIEVQAGAAEVVHHVLVFAQVPAGSSVTQSGSAPANVSTPQAPVLIRNRAQERTPPEPPRQDSLNGPPARLGAVIATEAPGTSTNIFPAGTALRLRKGTVLTFQIHYTAHGHAMTDRTRIGFKFAPAPPAEEVFTTQFINGQFTLPAGAKDVSVPAEIGFGQPVRIWGMLPHTHLRGTRWQYVLQNPDGSSRVILDVPHYDFNWQTFYMYAKPLEIAAGSKILSTAWYDNSKGNPSNPNAAADVHWGDQTWNEMQYTAFIYSVVKHAAATGTRQRH